MLRVKEESPWRDVDCSPSTAAGLDHVVHEHYSETSAAYQASFFKRTAKSDRSVVDSTSEPI